jgi:ribosome-associated protein
MTDEVVVIGADFAASSRDTSFTTDRTRSQILTNQSVPTTAERAVLAARAAADKLGTDTVVLEVGEVLSIVEYFVITGAPNTRQVRSIAEDVEEQIKLVEGVGPIRVEGLNDGTWVLLDYGDVVVHVFLDETREFYDLERLWSDVGRMDWEQAVTVGE